ncbi:MAG: DEAD/DEAH box helicase [Bacilli bacterium]|nr:DEAD/DEAH box helicase [Bacilli bacterium]
MDFNNLEIKEEIKKAINDLGFSELTEIQEKVIPIALNYRDLIGQAPTGTGKTLGFAIPIINMIDPSSRDVEAVIMAPTRELALQITSDINDASKYLKGVNALTIYGGELIDKQINALRRHPQIIVATPGRLLDHLKRKTISLKQARVVVLDEADEMLNMGFLDDIKSVLEATNTMHLTMLFSATFSPEIEAIAKSFMIDPVKIRINHGSLTVKQIEQKYIYCNEADKIEVASRIIEINNYKLVMIFCNTKKAVDDVTSMLLQRGFLAESLHGDMKQMQRDRVMARFREGLINILVASDVAARGLDIDDVDVVFNYDLPGDDEYYVHRIGRTGRAKKNGIAISLVSRGELRRLHEIEHFAKVEITKQDIPSLDKIVKIRTKRILDRACEIASTNNLEEISYDDNRFLSIIDKQVSKYNDVDKDSLIKGLLSIIINADSRNTDIEEIKEEIDKRRSKRSNGGVRIYISLGRIDDIRVYTITDMLVKNTSLSNKDINNVSIYERFSFFEVPKEYVKEVTLLNKELRYKGKRLTVEVASANSKGEAPKVISGKRALDKASHTRNKKKKQ